VNTSTKLTKTEVVYAFNRLERNMQHLKTQTKNIVSKLTAELRLNKLDTNRLNFIETKVPNARTKLDDQINLETNTRV